MELIEKLQWRYATKAMNGQKVGQDKIDTILKAISLAPTSSGLQPFEVIVITNPELKKEIQKVSWNQPVVADCSHLFIFAAWDTYTEARINRVFDLTNKIRDNKDERLENYRQKLLSVYPLRNEEENFQHAARQAYIALSQGITAAAFLGIDTTPMEGFEPEKVDQILNLREKGLRSCVMMAVGYRDIANDRLVGEKKVRKPITEMVTFIN